MTFPVLRLTRGAQSSAPILADLNDRDPWFLTDQGFDFGTPQMGALGGGVRQVSFELASNAPSLENSSSIAAISRALVASGTVFLQWRRNSSAASTWFRVLPGAESSVDVRLLRVDDDGAWLWTLTLQVEGYSYGALVTLPTVTLQNGDDTLISDSFSAKLPDVRGDVPSAVTLDCLPSQSWGSYRALLNVAQGNGAIVWRCGYQTPGVGTSPVFLTGYANSSPGTAGSALIAGTTYTSTAPTSPAPGRYAVFAQVQSGNSGIAHLLKVGRVLSGAKWLTPVTVPASATRQWVRLGEWSFPVTAGDVDDLSSADLASPTITVTTTDAYAQPAASWPVGQPHIAVGLYKLALVPVTTSRGPASTTMVTEPSVAAGSGSGMRLVVDSLRRRVLHRISSTSGTNLYSAEQSSLEAGTTGSSTAGGSVPPTVTNSAVRAAVGTKSLLATWGTGGTFPNVGWPLPGVLAGRRYVLTAQVWVPAGSPAVVFLVPDDDGANWSAGSTTTGAWQTLTLRFSATENIAAGAANALQLWPTTAPTSGQQVWVDDLQLKQEGVADEIASIAPPRVDGSTGPLVVPGEANYLTVLHRTNNGGAADSDAATCAVVASYHPRWLNLAAE